MRIKLEFHLPEDKDDFDLAMDGWKYRSVLSEFNQWLGNEYELGRLRHQGKHDVRDKLYEITEEYEVEI